MDERVTTLAINVIRNNVEENLGSPEVVLRNNKSRDIFDLWSRATELRSVSTSADTRVITATLNFQNFWTISDLKFYNKSAKKFYLLSSVHVKTTFLKDKNWRKNDVTTTTYCLGTRQRQYRVANVKKNRITFTVMPGCAALGQKKSKISPDYNATKSW